MPCLELTFDMRRPSWVSTPLTDFYSAALDICAWADANDFQAVSLGEHHSTDDDYLSSPLVMATAIAARTRKLQLRMILLAPFYHPLRLAEDLHVLEVLSGGRCLPVISGGYRPAEFEMFGIRLEERLAVMDETIEVLKKAGRGAPFRYRGREIERVSPVPEKPMRVLIGGSFEKVIRHAAHSLADGCRPGEVPAYEYYRDELSKLGKPDPGPAPKYGPTFLYVTENPEQAWTTIGPHVLHWTQSYASYAAESNRAGRMNPAYKAGDTVEALKQNPNLQVLTPEQCLVYAASYGPADVLRLAPLAGGLDPKFAWAGIELFENKVLPHLDVNFTPNLLF